MMQAELDGVVCSGGRRGKQFTYALLEERVPQVKAIAREEALAEFVKRYFISHGPATLKDFTKWSGLTMTDARAGLESVKSLLASERLDERDYWFTPSAYPKACASDVAYLLPNYDEYFIGYHDPSATFDAANYDRLIFSHVLVVGGRIAGTWRRTITRSTVNIEINFFTSPTEAERHVVTTAAEQYGKFLGKSVELAY
jgi:hypothetical protein